MFRVTRGWKKTDGIDYEGQFDIYQDCLWKKFGPYDQGDPRFFVCPDTIHSHLAGWIGRTTNRLLYADYEQMRVSEDVDPDRPYETRIADLSRGELDYVTKDFQAIAEAARDVMLGNSVGLYMMLPDALFGERSARNAWEARQEKEKTGQDEAYLEPWRQVNQTGTVSREARSLRGLVAKFDWIGTSLYCRRRGQSDTLWEPENEPEARKYWDQMATWMLEECAKLQKPSIPWIQATVAGTGGQQWISPGFLSHQLEFLLDHPYADGCIIYGRQGQEMPKDHWDVIAKFVQMSGQAAMAEYS